MGDGVHSNWGEVGVEGGGAQEDRRVFEAGVVETRGSRGAKICSRTSQQQNVLVLVLYKVMSSAHVGEGRADLF